MPKLLFYSRRLDRKLSGPSFQVTPNYKNLEEKKKLQMKRTVIQDMHLSIQIEIMERTNKQ